MDPELLHPIVGLSTAGVVVLLTAPAVVHRWKTTARSEGGYIQLGEDNYEDRDGIATEDSIRAFSDTRPRVALWLGTVIGLGGSIAAGILALKGDRHADVLSSLSLWAEPVCWVKTQTLLSPAGSSR